MRRRCWIPQASFSSAMMTFVTFLALSATGTVGPRGCSTSRLLVLAKGATAFLIERRPPPAAPRYGRLLSQSTNQRYHESRPSVWHSSSSGSARTTETDHPPQMPTNQELVQRRLQAAREKREARQRSVQERALRNLQLRRLVSTTTTSSSSMKQPNATAGSQQPHMYALRVTVSPELRALMKHQLRGRERRGRVFVEESSSASSSVAGLRKEIQRHFASLRRDSYILHASFPAIIERTNEMNETIKAVEYPNADAPQSDYFTSAGENCWAIETDEDVLDLLSKARAFQLQHPDLFARPTMVLQLVPNPHAPPPPPPPAYLEGMQDPRNSSTLTMLSFYGFPPTGIADPDAFALQLRKRFKPFQALGRVYVAAEGVNAQMSVPTNVVPNFVQCCQSIPSFGEYIENGINIDRIPVSRHEQHGVEQPSSDDESSVPTTPFKSLHVRVRRQVVADGLDKSYDWQSAGYDMPPLEWHEALRRATMRRQKSQLNASGREAPSSPQTSDEEEDDEPLPILLDCRNKYETDIGTFEGAEPLNTENFRDSWGVLEERLKDVPKDAPIMTFCTGGIRCVKVGAYLTQELGFTNVSRLAAGIIGYDRTLQENQVKDSMFKGTNFVFDGRLGRPITEDALGTCFTCGAETSLICNCRNNNCHKRITQCEQCRTAFQGTCSDACRQRLVNGMMAPRRGSTEGDGATRPTQEERDVGKETYTTLEEYSSGFSSPLPPVYEELILNTRALIPSGSHMVSGGAQGRLLTQLASMTREGRILELGTFTGYATACLLQGAMNAATSAGMKRGCREQGPYVMTLERDAKAFDIASRHMEVIASKGYTTEARDSLALLRDPSFALCPGRIESSVSLNCAGVATCELVRVSDALAAVEELARSERDGAPAPFDLVFVDADKTRLFDYVNVFLGSGLLKRGGLIIVDNVLYKGLVLEAAGGAFPSLQDTDDDSDTMLRKNRRQRRLASKMHRFNEAIVGDVRAEVTILPLRDGLSVIRKR